VSFLRRNIVSQYFVAKTIKILVLWCLLPLGVGAFLPSNPVGGVRLDYNDRRLAFLLATNHNAKEVAATWDVAAATIYRQIRSMCERVDVVGIPALIIWILQHPACLFANVTSCAGLHVQPCDCGSPYCLGMIAAQLAPRTNLEMDERERTLILAGLAAVGIETAGLSDGIRTLGRQFGIAT